LAVRPILSSEKPILHQKAKPVQRADIAIRKTLRDMVDTMRDAPGVGLAGPQMGVPLRLVVIEYEETLYKLINPEITWLSSERLVADEGCLSLPGYIGAVERAESVRVRAKNEQGKAISLHPTGWLARIFQHEIDHLDGIMFSDRMAPGERLRPAPDYDDIEEDVASGQ
jgi:peptide deformylase